MYLDSHQKTPLSQAPSGQPVAVEPSGDVPSVVIPQAMPEWIAIPGKLDRIAMNPNGILPYGGVIHPVDDRPVFRTDSNEPGTDSPGTTLVYGHNYISEDGAFVPFSALEFVAVGDTIELGLPGGVLRYTVQQTFTVPKKKLVERADIFQNVPNRLVLITCDTVDGANTYDNRVVIADLSM